MKENEPPKYTFFTDRDLGNAVPDALEAEGLCVERHDDHFHQDAKDREWLSYIGPRGWVGLTHNADIRRVERQRDMVMRARVRLFVLIGHYDHPRLAQNLVHSIHKVRQFLHRHSRYGGPFITRLYMAPEHKFDRGKGGEISMWKTYDEWREEQGLD